MFIYKYTYFYVAFVVGKSHGLMSISMDHRSGPITKIVKELRPDKDKLRTKGQGTPIIE